MRSKIVIALSFMIALSAFADRAHDIFNANREKILTNDFSVIDDVAFVVGRAKSPKNRGDAVGWTKAEATAKWFIGDRFRISAMALVIISTDASLALTPSEDAPVSRLSRWCASSSNVRCRSLLFTKLEHIRYSESRMTRTPISRALVSAEPTREISTIQFSSKSV